MADPGRGNVKIARQLRGRRACHRHQPVHGSVPVGASGVRPLGHAGGEIVASQPSPVVAGRGKTGTAGRAAALVLPRVVVRQPSVIPGRWPSQPQQALPGSGGGWADCQGRAGELQVLGDLAGNAFNVRCVMAMLLCVMAGDLESESVDEIEDKHDKRVQRAAGGDQRVQHAAGDQRVQHAALATSSPAARPQAAAALLAAGSGSCCWDTAPLGVTTDSE